MRGVRDIIIDIHCQMLYRNFAILDAAFSLSGSMLVLLITLMERTYLCAGSAAPRLLIPQAVFL